MIIQDVSKEIREPLLDAIHEVKQGVFALGKAVVVSSQETSKANLLANIEMERLLPEDAFFDLKDRAGEKALAIVDDFAKDEPIFIVDPNYAHRMRVKLAHKHQSDCGNYRIRYICVKPSDGIELGLRVFQSKPLSEGSEVVALFHADWFQSPRLSSKCPQFGTLDERYVSVAVTIGIEAIHSPPSGLMSNFELKSRILCHPDTEGGFKKIRRFRKYASVTWRRSPQWIRSAAQGAVILASTGSKGLTQTDPSKCAWGLCSIISALFCVPLSPDTS